jgi:hypothetical protein
MKIIQHNNWAGREREVSISDAIEGSIDDSVESCGVAEDANHKADNCAKILGMLVQNLHERKLLTDDEIKDMLNWRYTVEE